MGAKYTLDHTNRLFILDQVAPDGNDEVVIDVQIDLYSDWKEDVLSGTFNAGVDPPFRTVAGDPLGGGEKVPPYFFFLNGWKVRPYEADHTLILKGNAYADPSSNAMFVPTVGAFTVLTAVQRSVAGVGLDYVNVGSINNNTQAAVNLAEGADSMLLGLAKAGVLSTTQMSTTITELTDDHFNGRVIIFTSGALRWEQADIQDYAGWNGTYSLFTLSQLTDTPQVGDSFIIV